MSKDFIYSYLIFYYVSECFGIDPVERLIQERQDKFIKYYIASENVLCIVSR